MQDERASIPKKDRNARCKIKGRVYQSKIEMQEAKPKAKSTEVRHECRMQIKGQVWTRMT